MFRPEPGDQAHSRVVDGKTHVWDVRTLWKMASQRPVEDVPVSKIVSEVLEDWFGGNAPTAAAMAAAKSWAVESDHAADRSFPAFLAPGGRPMELWIWEAIMKASLDYAIIVDAAYTIMDGGHRLSKAILLDEPTIRCVRLVPTPPPHAVIDSVSPQDCTEFLRSLPERPKQEQGHRTIH